MSTGAEAIAQKYHNIDNVVQIKRSATRSKRTFFQSNSRFFDGKIMFFLKILMYFDFLNKKNLLCCCR